MAVNHADGTMFVAVPVYPIAAGIGAARAGAGWLTPLFIVAGLAVGLCITVVGGGLWDLGCEWLGSQTRALTSSFTTAVVGYIPLSVAFAICPSATLPFGILAPSFSSSRTSQKHKTRHKRLWPVCHERLARATGTQNEPPSPPAPLPHTGEGR